MLGVPDHLFECLLEQRYPSEHEAKPKKNGGRRASLGGTQMGFIAWTLYPAVLLLFLFLFLFFSISTPLVC